LGVAEIVAVSTLARLRRAPIARVVHAFDQRAQSQPRRHVRQVARGARHHRNRPGAEALAPLAPAAQRARRIDPAGCGARRSRGSSGRAHPKNSARLATASLAAFESAPRSARAALRPMAIEWSMLLYRKSPWRPVVIR